VAGVAEFVAAELKTECLAAWPKWQGQNPFSALIHHEHHQSQIVVAAFLAQLLDCVLGIRKGRRNIWQIRTIRIILDPITSVYREEILRHRLPPPANCHAPRNGFGSLAMFAAIRRTRPKRFCDCGNSIN